MPCSSPKCRRPAHSRGLCSACYRRRWKRGDWRRNPAYPASWRVTRRWWRALENDPVLFRATCLSVRTYLPSPEPEEEWRSPFSWFGEVTRTVHRLARPERELLGDGE